MKDIFVHVEEPSMEAYLRGLLPRLGLQIHCKIINHGSKSQLLRNVPQRLAGYARMPLNIRPGVLVLVDRDNDDCLYLKNFLENAAYACGMPTKSRPDLDNFLVVNRIVVSELESWHFGNVAALRKIFPKLPKTLASRKAFRDSDAIAGGVHEALLRELKRVGYFEEADRLPKIDLARQMGMNVELDANSSHSFRNFINGLYALAAQLHKAAYHG